MTARALPPPASPRLMTALVLAASVAVLGGALLFQYADGLAPCELCLYERWPWYAAIVLAMIGLLAGGPAAQGWILGACTLLFVASAGLAAYHVAVEQHWIAGPVACTGAALNATSIEALKEQLLQRQAVSCDQAAWRLFGVSLAGWNLLASLAVAAFAGDAAWRLTRSGRR